MDKRSKQHLQKQPNGEQTPDVTPPGASFDTEAGRAAQGMREDLGDNDADAAPDEEELDSAMGGASDGSSGGGAGSGVPGGGTDMRTGGRFDKGDAAEDRQKIFPEAKPKK